MKAFFSWCFFLSLVGLATWSLFDRAIYPVLGGFLLGSGLVANAEKAK